MSAALKQLDELTECSICTRIFTDPRVLPCVHTYCLNCIQNWTKNKRPADKLSCPLCRKECPVPEDGLASLPRNFFVEKMLHIRELTSVEVQSTSCDMCTYRAESGAANINPATTYCLECQENLCHTCAAIHRKQKISRDHKLLQIGDRVKPEDLYSQYPPARCDKHADETLKIYCNDCQLVICMMCYIKDHNSHQCSDVNEVFDGFRTRLTTDADNVVSGVDKCKQILHNLDTERKWFSEQILRTQRKIHERARQLKDLIEKQKQSLLRELASVKEKRTKEMKAAYKEVQRHMAAMESYKKYVHEIREKGTPCDIARAASALHERADELLTFDAIQRTLDDLDHGEITFSATSFEAVDFTKSMGVLETNTITLDEILSRSSTVSALSHAVRSVTAVYAVTSLANRVYTVRNLYEMEVEVYDAGTMALQERLPVPKLSCVSGIAACPRYNCLYVGDWNMHNVHRVDPTGCSVTKKWAVAKTPEGLSVNNASNLLVSCLAEDKLQEYTTHGDLVREIRLEGLTNPRHAIQLSTGDYVVSQYTSPGMVSVVAADGRVVRSFRQCSPQRVESMKYPTTLAVTKSGDILVADGGNNRILAINSALTSAQEFPIPADVVLRRPHALWLDEANDRLYVAETRDTHRLLAFSNVNCISWKNYKH